MAMKPVRLCVESTWELAYREEQLRHAATRRAHANTQLELEALRIEVGNLHVQRVMASNGLPLDGSVRVVTDDSNRAAPFGSCVVAATKRLLMREEPETSPPAASAEPLDAVKTDP